jgi:methionyl-tRNA formyltransferase
MQMEAGLDSGPILLQEETAIGEGETAGELGRRLAEIGAALVVRTLEELEKGALAPRPQDAAEATYAPRLTRDSGRVDWSRSARALRALLLAYTPWPGLTAELGGAPVKLVRAEPLSADVTAADDAAEPGTVLGLRGGRLAVACGEGTVLGIEELQRPGRKALRAADFVNGERLRSGEKFS